AAINISDPIRILRHLFRPDTIHEEPSCAEALDANDDDRVDLSDAISLLLFLFLPSRKVLPSPFPNCGVDQKTDDLGCDEFQPCA
ncbi:MAG: hypothetical protein AAF517_07820, partial [Planctomycetota bacterium]